MWRAVIRQALDDATLTNEDGRESRDFYLPRRVKAEKRRALIEARDWFRDADEDFQLVCELAGLVWAKVQAWALGEIRKFDSAVGAMHLELKLFQR